MRNLVGKVKFTQVSKVTTLLKNNIFKYSPELLLGTGIATGIFAVGYAIFSSEKSSKAIASKKEELGKEELTFVEKTQATWKVYLPVVLSEGVSIFCLISSNRIVNKRSAALSAALTLTESALKEYQDKVKDVVGEGKAKEIKSELVKDQISSTLVPENADCSSYGIGDTLMFDVWSGRYFKSDVHFLNEQVARLSYDNVMECGVTLNDFYSLIGIPTTKAGEVFAWEPSDGAIELDFEPHKINDEEVCFAIDFLTPPKAGKYRYLTA